MSVLLLLLGLALVVFGADFLVDGASAVARRAGISEFVIGLTIVGFGTSCPELVVSVTGALQGNADIAVGNVVGSNAMNVLLILGLTALVQPVAITASNRHRDMPIMLLVSFLLLFAGMNHSVLGIGNEDMLSRVEGIVFLILFVGYIYYCFRSDSPQESPAAEEKIRSIPLAVLLVGGGLAALVFGGRLFVDAAEDIARALGLSDKFIAVTILAGGTSLPELATSVVAACKKRGQLALGNIIGSCIFNILLILGCAAVISPLHPAGLDRVDMGVLAGSAILLWLTSYTGRKDRIDRFEGAGMVLCFIAYYAWLFCHL
ncbi:MAG: calcium/sodium antiporter [Bacteroidales bacterium]|nr:calcium/sodium antiporter [Bacteroidales bacterium]